MRAVQHVFRRDSVYWWRRRVLKKAGERERVTIAISMKTRELAMARSIAARLTLHSDQILNDGSSAMLSSAQVKTMLTTVAGEHLRKLARISALELADGVPSAEGRHSDLVMGWSLRLKAARGPHATVEAADHAAMLASGLSEAGISEVDATIVLLRNKSPNPVPRARILALLEACSAPQSEGDIREAAALLLRGQAAALLAVDRRWSGQFSGDDDLIEGLQEDALNAEPADRPQFVEARVADPVTNGETERAASSGDLTVPSARVSMLRLTERLIEEKTTLGEWRPKTCEQVRSVVELFVKMMGADDVALINQSRIADYRSLLLKLPKTYGKSPADKDRALAEVLARAKTLKPKQVGRQGTTLNRHLNQLKSVLEYIEISGASVADYAGVEKLRAKTGGRARNARNLLSVEDQIAIFSKPPWHGCRTETKRLEAGPLIVHDALYWVPILAKTTLARREELCGLDVEDVLEEDGIHFLYIRDNVHRRLKNQQSNRRVPLHDENIRLGLLRYHREIKALGYKLMFPELKAHSDRTPLGDVFHGEWVKLQNLVIPNAEMEKKSFHSLRKTSANDLKDGGVSSELRADILGHGGGNITEERYAGSAKLAQMLEALKKLPNFTADIVASPIRLRVGVAAKRFRARAKPRRRSLASTAN